MDKIFRCAQCNELFRPTEYDTSPAYTFDEKSQYLEEVEVDDLQDFMSKHKGHEVTELRIIKKPFYSNCDYQKLIREDYFEASDGASTFTIRRWRRDINQPMKYEIVGGRIYENKPIFRVQSDDLKKQMLFDADMLLFNQPKIDKFVSMLKDFVQTLTEEDVSETMFSDNPAISYVTLNDATVERLLKLCSSEFREDELQRLRQFIAENSEYDDVMNIRVVQQFQLTRRIK